MARMLCLSQHDRLWIPQQYNSPSYGISVIFIFPQPGEMLFFSFPERHSEGTRSKRNDRNGCPALCSLCCHRVADDGCEYDNQPSSSVNSNHVTRADS